MTERPLPAGWARITLGEIGRWYGGGTPSKRNPDFWTAGTIPWLSPKDMGPSLLSGTQDHITDAAIAGSSASLVPANSVAFVVRSGILERRAPIALVPFATTMNQDMKAVFPSEAVDPRWLLYILQSQERIILDHCRKDGTTVASLDTAKLHGLSIDLPPLAEQHRIVEAIEEHISLLDSGERTISRAMARSATLSSATINFSNDSPTCTLNYAEPPSRADVVDGDLPRIPASWKWRRLGEFSEVVGGITKDTKKQSDDSFPLHPYLRVANVQAGHLNLDHIAEIRATPKQAKKLTLQSGDILLNEGGDRDKLGRGWVWENQIPNCLHQNHVFRSRVDPGEINPRLVAWHANSFGREWFTRNGKQSVNLASVSMKTIKLFPVPVPPAEEQALIVDRITATLESQARLRHALDIALARSGALRRSLLSAAFNGELVDQNPADEPASVALAKIRAEAPAKRTSGRRKSVAAQ